MTDTPEIEAPLSRREVRSWRFLIMTLVGVCILLLANNFINLPYSVLSPGQATGVTGFINIKDAKVYNHPGDVLFTTVNVRQQTHPFDLFWAKILPGEQIEKREAIVGQNVTPQQYLKLNQDSMDESKMSAITVAMRRAGFPVTPTGKGALVQQLAESSPAVGKLNPGDTVTRLNDTDIHLSTDLTTAIGALAPNTTVTLVVANADDISRTVTITAGARPGDATKAYLGVVVGTAGQNITTPFPVAIDTQDIGGPSAGLAFTLALLDQLTPGELTGGEDIAVTGTIEPDGTVGPVGGVKQKAGAVNRTKAKLFLVPSDEFADASKAVDSDVKVVKVDTLQQAIDALAANGGDVSGIPATPASAAS